MTLVMGIIHRSGLAKADMVRAIGSLYTGQIEGSLAPGLIFHFVAGILFAFAYALFIGIFAPGLGLSIIAGGIVGTFHGMAVCLGLIIVVAEHHPIEDFQHAGVGVAVAHLVGHIVYGVTVGVVLGITGSALRCFAFGA